MSAARLTHPLLEACGVVHGFGLRGMDPPEDVWRPVQVHGADVVEPAAAAPSGSLSADAVVSARADRPIGVVTADCVPILAASRSGRAVAAIHAGWKGLAAGVIPAAIVRLRERADGDDLVAVVGPHIGPAHYEVDGPVLGALRPAFGDGLDAALAPARPGHAQLDLGRLARAALLASGVRPDGIASVPDACTYADARRFHSYRRDGAAAGRMLHFVAARGAVGEP